MRRFRDGRVDRIPDSCHERFGVRTTPVARNVRVKDTHGGADVIGHSVAAIRGESGGAFACSDEYNELKGAEKQAKHGHSLRMGIMRSVTYSCCLSGEGRLR